jgi:hypothetical protein
MPKLASISFNTRVAAALDNVARHEGKSRSVLVNEILSADPRITEALKSVAPEPKQTPKRYSMKNKLTFAAQDRIMQE